MTESNQDSTGPRALEQRPATPASPTLRIGAVFKIVVPAVVILGGAFVFFGLLDGKKKLAELIKPPLVAVTGQVLLNGEPLPHAEVATQPIKPGVKGAFGTADESGHFKLMTHVDGDFLEGAYQGEHRVTVIRRHNVTTLGVPPLMTPEPYASFDSSPLRIVVPSGQSAELRLEGELSAPPPPRPAMVQRPPPGSNLGGDAGDQKRSEDGAKAPDEK